MAQQARQDLVSAATLSELIGLWEKGWCLIGMFHDAAELHSQINNQCVTQASVGHLIYVLLTKPTVMEVIYSSVPGRFEMLCREHGHCQKHCAELLVT